MMKILILILTILICGCTGGGDADKNPEESYRTIIIEGHEYIFISRRPWSSEMAIAHKANCSAHKANN